MDYEKQIFENSTVRAPDDFVSKTMNHIRLTELDEAHKATAKIEYSFFKLGQICVAAALLMVVLNVSPIAKIVYGQGNKEFPTQQESIVGKAVDKVDDIFDDIKELIDFNFFDKLKGEQNG